MPDTALLHKLLALRVAGILLWITVFMLPIMGGSSCPSVCICRWKGGKETTECIGKNLMSIPLGIDVGTQVLDMTRNNLQTLPKDAFQRNGLLNLQKIYLVSCNLNQIDRQAFNRLSNLVELDLSNNMLTTIPSESFLGMPDLRRLVLNGNPIQQVETKAFATLRSLIILELTDCKLELINKNAFAELPNLETLKLSGNQLSTLSMDVLQDLQSLHSVLLVDNPWNCNCYSRDFRRWLIASRVPYYISPQCFEPARLRGFALDKLILEDFACAPVGSASYRVLQVQTGNNVSLECKVTSDPEAFIHWLWQDNVITNTTGTIVSSDYLDGRTYLVEENGGKDKVSTLTLESVDEKDAGNYMCVAENRGGRFLVNFTLEVMAVPVRQQAPVVVNKGFLMGVIIGLGVFAILVLVLVCVLMVRFCHSRRHRRRRRRLKIPRSETQDTKGSSTYDSQNDPLNDKRDLQPPNPIQKPPRSFANSTYISTSEISLHNYNSNSQSKDGLLNLTSEPRGGGGVSGSSGGNGVYSIKPDIIKVDGDSGEYSVPRGQLINGSSLLVSGAGPPNNFYHQNTTGRWTTESPIATCHGCTDHSCLGVPCLHPYGADADAESETSYRAQCRPTASGLAGESAAYDDTEDEWPKPPPPIYDTVKHPIAIDMWQTQPSIPPRIEEGYEVDYATAEATGVAVVPTPVVWEKQSPTTAAAAAAAMGSGFPGEGEDFSQDNPGASKSSSCVHLKNSSVPDLSPFPLLNLSTVRDSPDEGYEDEGEEGTEV